MLRGGLIIMAKVEYEEDIVAFRGRGCKSHKNGRIFVKRANGTTYYYHLHNPCKTQTEAQKLQTERFKQATASTLEIMQDLEQLSTYVASFRKQKKYSTVRGYIFALEMEKLVKAG